MKNRIKIIFGILFVFGIATFSFGVSAATIFTDNFESYTNGDLNGQGGWFGSPGLMKIQSDVAFEGTKAVIANSPFIPTFIKYGTLQTDGKITVYVKRDDSGKGGFRLFEGIMVDIDVRFFSSNSSTNGLFIYRDINGNNQVFAISNSNTWYPLQIEWRSVPSHQVRYTIDGITWTNWVASYWDVGLDGIGLFSEGPGVYFDAIQENPIPSKTPVLIVPGLAGTEIKKGDEVLWADAPRMFRSIGDEFMDPLSFNSFLQPIDSQVLAGSVNRVVGPVDYTDGLFAELKNQGYIENETLFTFPYDWRYGVSGKYGDGKTNTDLLQQKIAEILTQTGAQKVDVIAHSMGGLIVKQYAANHLTDNHIGKAVFVGVPSTGAPYAIKDLLVGDNLGSFFVNQDEVKKISQNMPAIYDLLPSQQYYNTKGSYVKVIDQGFTGINPTVKDLTHQEVNNFLTADYGLNATAVANTDNLHALAFDNFDLRTAGIDLYAIDGCKAGTLGKIIEVKSKSILGQTQITYQKPKMVPGDGTVPLESATNLPIDQSHKFYSLTGEHSKIMSQDGSRQEIVNLLAGSALSVGNSITQDITKCQLNGKAISVFSPVDILVTDQDGHKLGLAVDGSIFNEIPNADFEIWGEPFGSAQDRHKFLYLPTDGGQTYTITIKGTGTGTYTIDSQNISDSQVTSTEVFSNLPVTTDLTGQINLGNSTTLTVTQHPGNQPETILPSATLDAAASEDVLPPLSTIKLDGKVFKAGQFKGEFKKDVVVTIKATDTVIVGQENATSGILNIQYNIDSTGFRKVVAGNTSFTVLGRGDHSIQFFATDKAGNNETLQIIKFEIKNPNQK